MYVSLLVVALTTTPAADLERGVRWEDSYTAARREARAQNKPLAVFLGNGADGWRGVLADGKMSDRAQEVLKRDYVPVYLDLSKPADQTLARSFEVTGPALVLSSRDGQDQAFRHEGEVPQEDLERTLVRYAKPDLEVTRTATLVSTEARGTEEPEPSTKEMAPKGGGKAAAPAAPLTGVLCSPGYVIHHGVWPSYGYVSYPAYPAYYAPAVYSYPTACYAPVSYSYTGYCGYSYGYGHSYGYCGWGHCR